MKNSTLPPPERRLAGMALRTCAAITFALMSALLKIASERGVTTSELIFYRNFGALPVVVAWVLLGPGIGAVRTSRPWAHVTRTFVGLFSMTFTFGAIVLLPLGAATTLTYSSPIIGTILGGLLLGERIGSRRWMAVLAGFVGVLLVVQPFGGSRLPPIGVLVALGAALTQACTMITLRTIGRTESTAAIVFWFTLATMLVGACILPFAGAWHGAGTTALLVLAGMFGGIGQLSITGSLRLAPVSVVVPFDYLQIVMAMLIGWSIFGDSPAVTMVLGAMLVGGSGIYTAYREHRRGRIPIEAAAPPLT